MSEPNLTAIYDLHSHTTASDGVLMPQHLVHRAVEMGVGVVAITDHGTTDGIAPAREEIERCCLPLTLINGVEISTLWENLEIHIVGLNVNIDNSSLVNLLALQSERRDERAVMIAERLEKARIPGALESAKHYAGDGVITRGHFARFLVETGYATMIANVFKHYLAKGKTGYVPPRWCTIGHAIDAIHHSGGVAVLAHPGRYHLSAKRLKRLLAVFAEKGGDAIEIAQCQQSPDERIQLARYAGQFGFMGSQGSDFHQPCPWIELGKRLWFPTEVKPVWTCWESSATVTERLV